MVSASQLQLEQTPAEPGRRPVEAPNRSIPMEGPWQKPPAASFLCPFRKRRVGAHHPFSVFLFTLILKKRRVKAPHPHHMTDALRPLSGLGGLIMEKNNTHFEL